MLSAPCRFIDDWWQDMKKIKMKIILVVLSLILIGCIVSIYSVNVISLQGRVLNEHAFEVECSKIWGYRYKYNKVMTGPKCKVEIKDDEGWHTLDGKEYMYLEYQNEIKENGGTNWMIAVSDDCILNESNEYRLTHEFTVFPKGENGNYKIITQTFYIR